MLLSSVQNVENKWPARLDEAKRIVDYAQTFLTNGRTATIDLTAQLQQIQRYWLDACTEKCEATTDDCSIAELLFWAYCLVYCCCEAELRPTLPVELVHPLNVQLGVAASTHKLKFMHSYPLSVVECPGQSVFWTTLIGWIAQHCALGSKALKETVSALPDFTRAQLSSDIVSSWEHLQIDVKTDADRVKREDVANYGYLFKMDKMDAVGRILPMACRTAAQIETERMLLNCFPIRQLRMKQHCTLKMQQWLVFLSRYEPDDSFGTLFREFVLELHLPLGARMRPKRRPATASNNDTAETLIEQELGIDLTQELLDQLLDVNYLALASDPDHRFHSCYLLCRFGHHFKQRLRRDFLKHFYIAPTQLLWQKQRFFRKLAYFSIKPSPLITRLGGHFYLYDKELLYKCADAYDVLLTWLWLSKTGHNNCTEFQDRLSIIEEPFQTEIEA